MRLSHAIFIIAVGCTFAVFTKAQPSGSRACSGAVGSIFTLVQVENSNSPNPFNQENPVVTVTLTKPDSSSKTVTISTGSTKCGTLQDGSGLEDDRYPTSSTYRQATTYLSPNNSFGGHMIYRHFIQNDTPDVGTTYFTSALADDSTCTAVDGGNTLYFYKICLNANTNARKLNLP